jgi:hypothetical protein
MKIFDGLPPALQWAVRYSLHIAYMFLARVFIAFPLLTSMYRLLIRAGAQLPKNGPFEHFLWTSLIAGILLGSLPLDLIASIFGAFRTQIKRSSLVVSWSNPQRWVWLPFLLLLLLRMATWLAGQEHQSILANAQTSVWTPMIHHFWFPDSKGDTFDVYSLINCGDSLLFTAPFVSALGYSLAAFFLRQTGSDTGAPTSEMPLTTVQPG